MFSQNRTPLKPGDELVPALMFRFLPLGVLSCAIIGMLFLAPALVVVGMINKPDLVIASLSGPNRHIWLYAGLCWLGLAVFNTLCGLFLARRRIFIEPDALVVMGTLARRERIETKNIAEIRKVISIAAMQGNIHLRYRDGRRAKVNCAAIGSNDLNRLAAYLAQ